MPWSCSSRPGRIHDVALLGAIRVPDRAGRRRGLAWRAGPGAQVVTGGRTSAVELAAASRSDPGRVRTNNEDLELCDPETGVYAVIDGVGGQAAGEVAAEIARTVILERLARPLGTPAERVREAIALANNEIFKEADGSLAHHGM